MINFKSPQEINKQSKEWYLCRGINLDEVHSEKRIHPLIESKLFEGENICTDFEEDVYLTVDFSSPVTLLSQGKQIDKRLENEILKRLEIDIFPNSLNKESTDYYEDNLNKYIEILEFYSSEIWESVKPFLSRVYFCDSSKISSVSWSDLLGAVCLGIKSTTNPIEGATNLLREALHAKTARTTRSFINFNPEKTAEIVIIPWWGDNRKWDIKRCIDALYVYVHIYKLLYYYSLENKNSVNIPLAKCSFRANYLSNILLNMPSELFGTEWKDMVDWLISQKPPLNNISKSGLKYISEAEFPKID